MIDCFATANRQYYIELQIRYKQDLAVTGVKHPPSRHSAAYNISYKLGTVDGKIGGSRANVSGACNTGTSINGTAATNQCLAGYFSAWNKYCPTSKYGCNT